MPISPHRRTIGSLAPSAQGSRQPRPPAERRGAGDNGWLDVGGSGEAGYLGSESPAEPRLRFGPVGEHGLQRRLHPRSRWGLRKEREGGGGSVLPVRPLWSPSQPWIWPSLLRFAFRCSPHPHRVPWGTRPPAELPRQLRSRPLSFPRPHTAVRSPPPSPEPKAFPSRL